MDDDYDYHQEWKDNIAQGIHDAEGNPIDPEPPDEPSLADLLMWTAEGTFGEEAAVWLLDQHGHWLDELDRLDLIRHDSTGYSFVRWDEFTEARPVGTGSEIQVLNVAHALATANGSANGVTSFRGLTSLDESNRRLVLHAIAWAMGGRAWARSLYLTSAGGWDGGRSSGPQADPWPADEPPF